jgi:hypothetical protein
MKKKTIGIILLLAILTLLLMLSSCSQRVNASPSLSAAAFSAQVATPTPPVEDRSEIGSTNGIFIMGVVLVTISILPLLFHKKKK